MKVTTLKYLTEGANEECRAAQSLVLTIIVSTYNHHLVMENFQSYDRIV